MLIISCGATEKLKHTPEKLAALLTDYQKNKNQTALEQLCKASEDIMRSYFRKHFTDPALIDDLCQETYIRLLRTLPTIQEALKYKKFVLKVSFYVMQTHLRQKYRRSEEVASIDLVDETQQESFTDSVHHHKPMENLSQRMDLKRALNELPEKTREILLLKADGYKYEEIARTLGLSVSGVKMQVKRGMEKLKNSLISVTFWWFIATCIVDKMI
jgi:RNA polymerase sigma-70 factor (ECF subfamily)